MATDATDFSYYDDLRRSSTATSTPLVAPDDPTHLGRNLHEISDSTNGLDDPIILCHVPSFFRWTLRSEDAPGGFTDVSGEAYGGSAAALMAIHHFNNGDGSIVDELDGLNNRCRIRFTTELVDTHSSGIDAVHDLTRIISRKPVDVESPQPCAVLGSSWSDETRRMATVTGVYDLLQVTSSASSVSLDNKGEYPLFARTHPSDAAMAQWSVSYLKTELDVKFFGTLFVNNDFGSSYNQALEAQATLLNMTQKAVDFPPSADEATIRVALEKLQATGYNYFMGVFYAEDYERVMEIAGEMEMAGPGRFWLFTGLLTSSLVNGNTQLKSDSHAAKASLGNAIVHDEGGLPGFPQFDRFLEKWKQLGADADALDYVNSKVPLPPPDTGISFERTSDFFSKQNPSHIATFSYDAIVGMALSACAALNTSSTNGTIFSGVEHHQAFVESRYFGSTGEVVIGPSTYSRNESSTYFVISNILNVSHDAEYTSFQATPWKYFDTVQKNWTLHGALEQFTYSDLTSEAPNQIPDANVNMNTLTPAIRGVCLGIAGAAMALSIALFVFTFVKRKERVIRAAQPPFLLMLCVGTLVMASSIIPASIDDSIVSQSGCSVACVSKAWLVPVGFCVVFSALFSKLWRINKLFKNASGFKRVKVLPQDVIVPFLLLFSSNILVLSLWTALYPPTWTREVLSYDAYDRVIESQGHCKSEKDLPFIVTVGVLNGCALLLALWQAYLARKISTEFSESKFIGMAMVCIVEACFIGIPIFFLVKDQPDVQLFIFSGIILIVCLSILLLLFVPKITVMRKGEEGLPRNYRASGSVWVAGTEVARDSRRGSSSEMRQDVLRAASEMRQDDLRASSVEMRQDDLRASSVEMRQDGAWNQKSLVGEPETLISVPRDESDALLDHPIDESGNESGQDDAWNQKILLGEPETLNSVPNDESDALLDHPINENGNESGQDGAWNQKSLLGEPEPLISVPNDESDTLSDHPIDENGNESGPPAATIFVLQGEKGDNE